MREENMLKKFRIKNLIYGIIISLSFCFSAFASNTAIVPGNVLLPSKQANIFENRLGAIEVGVTTKKVLEQYIGEGESIKGLVEETVYYIDPKYKKTLIVNVDSKGVITVANYKNFIELPPGKSNINQVKISKRLNIKNLMTSMGSRMGYTNSRIVNSYGRPSVELTSESERQLKYIKTGSIDSPIDFVYLEYSFRLVNNKVVEIRIENGK
jgi:hypothetical protein